MISVGYKRSRTHFLAFASHILGERDGPKNPRTHSTVTYPMIVAFFLYVTIIVQDSSRHTLLIHADLKHKRGGQQTARSGQ